MPDTATFNNIAKSFIANKREVCKQSFYEFFKAMFTTVCKEEFTDNWHIKYICDELDIITEWIINRKPKQYDLIINISPGETKTTIVSQLWDAYLKTRDPRIRFIGTSHTYSLSVKNAMWTKTCLESDEYKILFKPMRMKKSMDNKGHWMTLEGGERLSTSVGSAITGNHCHVKVYDDLIDATKIYSDAEIQAANEHIDAMATRNVNDENTVNVMIMQRLSINDPTAHAIKKWRNVKHIVLPAESRFAINPPELKKFYVNGLMNPFRKPRHILDWYEHKQHGTTKYSAEFGQQPLDLTGKVLKGHHFKFLDEDKFYDNLSSARLRSFLDSKIFGTADLAYTEKEINDPSGLLLFKYWENILYLVDYYEWKLEAPDLIEKITEVYDKYEVAKVAIENKASGDTITQLLRRKAINAIRYVQKNKDRKARLVGKLYFIEAERVVFLTNPENEERLKMMYTKLIAYPSKGVNDESVDVLVMAIDNVDRNPRQL